MTRITDFGRKRTYVEAGFADTAPETPADDGPLSAEPVKKKRKRAGKPGRIPGAVEPPVQPKSAADVQADDPAAMKRLSYKAKKLRKLKEKKGQLKPRPDEGHWTQHKDSGYSEQRRNPHLSRRHADLTCFSCRERGHSAADCPKSSGVGICYRCGSKSHSLSSCPTPALPSNELPFASCFVCASTGHLASACPQNAARGVYPNGGCCKRCGETTHLAKDCPAKQGTSGAQRPSSGVGTGGGAGADEDDFHAGLNREEKTRAKTKTKVASDAPPMPKGAPKAKKVVTF